MPPETPKNQRIVALSDLGVTNREVIKGCACVLHLGAQLQKPPFLTRRRTQPGATRCLLLPARPGDIAPGPAPAWPPRPAPLRAVLWPGPFPGRSTGPPRRPPRVLQAWPGRCRERGPPGCGAWSSGRPSPREHALALSPQAQYFFSALRNCVPYLSAPPRPVVLPTVLSPNCDLAFLVAALF